MGEPARSRLAGEALPDRQHAGEEQRRVNRREFAGPLARARAEVDEMVEPAALLGRALREEPKRGARPLDRGRSAAPTRARRRCTGQSARSQRRDAADIARVALDRRAIRPRPIAHEAGVADRPAPRRTGTTASTGPRAARRLPPRARCGCATARDDGARPRQRNRPAIASRQMRAGPEEAEPMNDAMQSASTSERVAQPELQPAAWIDEVVRAPEVRVHRRQRRNEPVDSPRNCRS